MDKVISIDFFSLRIDEPMVSLTDLLVSFFCIWFYFKMHKKSSKNLSFTYFKYYFLVMGLATLFGGLLGHAFQYMIGCSWKLVGWVISMFAIMLIERGAIEHAGILLKNKHLRALRMVNLVEFALFSYLTLSSLDFFYVQIHSGYGLVLIVLPIQVVLLLKNKNEASRYIIAGIGFAALSALTFSLKFSIHEWMNYLAISHIWMILATVFIYLGAGKMLDKND